MKLTRKVRQTIRKSLGSTEKAPFVIVPGIAIAPRLRGEGYHYTNKSGEYIQHPSAYSQRGWSSMVYHSSTRRIEVGELWIKIACSNCPSVKSYFDDQETRERLTREDGMRSETW